MGASRGVTFLRAQMKGRAVRGRRQSNADPFEFQPLEPRLLFAVPSITKAMRQELLAHWNGANKADLQAKLDANKPGAFDGLLLNYMATRGGNTFFWKTSDVAGIKSFVNAPNIATSTLIARADSIVAHKFPNGAT